MHPFTRDPFWLYLRTACYLRPIQLIFLIRNRLHLNSRKLPDIPRVSLRAGVGFNPGIEGFHRFHDNESFIFLNKTKLLSDSIPDWVCKDMPKLWRYNLHYFDYLHDSQRSMENKCLLITDWIQSNPPGTEDAWEPYTVSLRVVNWIKLFLSMSVPCVEESERQPKREWLESLYQQTLWLEQNIEYHILANHYLKNGVALFFAGMYFCGVDADRWFQKGLEILRDELKEQFLADGGHFERSPMYHSIGLVDYLDVMNLAQHSPAAISYDMRDEFTGKVTAALDFLSGICLPDGAIPLFNDSAFGIAPTPHQIFDYAEKVIGYKTPCPSKNSLVVSAFPSSGYYVCRKAGDMIIIDCGPIGPDYQPGHAHCDALSYELAIDGRRVVVDSGVFDYEPSQERAYARGTRAHNTVMVDGEEQSEIWGVFRVARRARPIQDHINKSGDESVLFEGAHDGYKRLTGKLIHRRRIACDGQGSWVVTDALEGTGIHRMENFVHIHPDFAIVESGESSLRIERCGEVIAIIEALSTCRVTIESGCYFPEFGLSLKNPVVAFSCSGEVPLQLSYRIRKARDRRIEAHRHANPLPITLLPSGGERAGNQNL